MPFKNKSFRYIILLVALWFLAQQKAFAQIEAVAGLNYSYAMNDGVLPNQEAIVTPMFGLLKSFQLEDSSIHHLKTGILFIISGYNQDFEETTYSKRFKYLALPLLYKLQLTNAFSVEAGAQFRMMILREEEYKYNYRREDIAAVFGFNLFEGNMLSIYANASYGILPMVSYQRVDEIGNFNGKIEDVHNTMVSLGIKFKLSGND